MKNRIRKPERSEFLLDLGRAVQRTQRHGIPLLKLARSSPTTSDLLTLADAFARASEVIKFRAIVEDWTLAQIRDAVRGQAVETVENSRKAG
jgi:hypothetical protein